MPQATYLDDILAAHRARLLAERPDVEALRASAMAQSAPRGFADRIEDTAGLAVIAEVKRRSPSKGDILPDLDPAAVAHDYEQGGAACLSVLTDNDFFGGSPEDLERAKQACRLPVLRKDFLLSEAEVISARAMGADAVLLIAAALTDEELVNLHTIALELEMDPLVEVHDEEELERAIGAGAELVGVNQRDLRTFEVDPDRAVRLAGQMPPEVVSVAESGIDGPQEAARLASVGYQAVLVGESFLRAKDRRAAVSAMQGKNVGSRPEPQASQRRVGGG